MKVFELVTCIVGLGAGLVAAWLSIITSERFGDSGFWRQLAKVSRLLVSSDEEHYLFREYLRLWPVLIVLVAKKFAVTAIAILPIALAFAALALLAGPIEDSAAAADWEFGFIAAVCVAAVLGVLVVKLKRRRLAG
jgi:hypothetical protein